MAYCTAYITCSDREEARKLASILLEEKLIACANIIPGMESLYVWEGKVQHDQEVILLCKMPQRHFEALLVLVQENHSYDVPCVLSLPIEKANPAFLQWIDDETT